MEYNKTKKVLDLIAGVLGIISASILLVLGLPLLISVISHAGVVSFIIIFVQLLLIAVIWVLAIIMLMFSIKLVKSPYLPNGELRNKKAARIWILVLAILSFDIILIGLMIAVLCLKDFKEPTVQPQMQQMNNFSSINIQTQDNKNELYDAFVKIQEVKKLKSLGIIDEVGYKKAVTKIVVDITRE